MKKRKAFLTKGATVLTLLAMLTLVSCERVELDSGSTSSPFTSSSGDSQSSQVETSSQEDSSATSDDTESVIRLNCTKTSILVGETTTISVANPNEGKSFIYVSSDESVATVSDDGVVSGVGEGKATIEVYQADDFSITGSIVINVFEGASSGSVVKVLAIDATNAVKEFKLGDPFESTGLVVTVDGVSVSDFTTNPQAGETLTSVGTQTIYVSYPGCESLSYDITVTPTENDYTLYNLVEEMLTASTYTYTIDVDASVQLDDDSIVSGMSYTYQYGANAFYLQTIAGDEVITDTTYTYGYVNTSKGVMKYQALDEVVTPISYASHSYVSYKSLAISDFQNMTDTHLAGIPLRETGGYYNVTNYNLMSYLTSANRTNLSGVASSVRTIRGYVLDNGFEFVLDCGAMGEITLRWSNFNSTTVPYIDDYLTTYGEEVEVPSEVTEVANLFKANNFTRSIYYSADGSTSSVAGTAYYHNDYLFYDYTDAYISYAAENSTTVVDTGYYIHDNNLYNFDLVDGEVTNVTLVEAVSEGATIQSYSGLYPSTLSMFNDNIDMLEATSITVSGTSIPTYGTSGDDLPEETFNMYGYESSVSAIAYQTGFYYSKGATTATSSVLIYVGYTTILASSVSYIGSTYANFGAVSNTVIETYLASLTTTETGGNA